MRHQAKRSLQMLFKRLATAALTTAVGLGAAGAALAEDVTVKSEDLSKLIQRLESAEKKIKELEAARLPDNVVAAPRALSEFDVSPSAANGASPSIRQAASSTVLADDPVISRLQNLENKWLDLDATDQKISDQLENGVVLEKQKSKVSNLKIEGRIHLDYWAFPDTDAGTEQFEGSGTPFTPQNPQDRFTTRRMRLGFQGDIKDNMLYVAQLEFAGVDDPEFRDLYIGFKDLPWLHTLLIGNQKRPYGLDHLNSSRYNVFLERPFVIESFNEDARRIGVASYGLSDDQAWNWRYGVYNMEKAHPDGQYVGDHYQLEVAGRLANTAWYDECTEGRSYMHWAVSGTIAHPDGTGGPTNSNESRFHTRPEARTSQRWLSTGRIADANTYGLLGLEGVVNLGPTQVVAEWQNIRLDRTTGDDVHLHGGYVYWSYFLTGEHIPWSRKSGTIGRVKPFENFFLVNNCEDCVDSGWGAWNVGVRYSYADFNDAGVLGGEGESLTFALNWHWNAHAKVQLNYIFGQVEARGAGVPAVTSGDYQIFGTRFAVDF
jgi:phosphate-selective porin OprO/OprP